MIKETPEHFEDIQRRLDEYEKELREEIEAIRKTIKEDE